MGFALPAKDGASGNQTYPPLAPDCVCGHAELLHVLRAGRRLSCGVRDARGRCGCLFYVEPDGVTDA